MLITISSEELERVEEKLNRHKIAYFIQNVSAQKSNIFFGKEQCIKIVRSFNRMSLTEFSCEEDFILGVMLGYDRMQQCERYLSRSCRKAKPAHPTAENNLALKAAI